MNIEVADKIIETNEQGFLNNPDNWNEQVATTLANRDDYELFVDHWELIWSFREYFDENQTNPTMHTLGKFQGRHFHDQKAYENTSMVFFQAIRHMKYAGLPMPQPDT